MPPPKSGWKGSATRKPTAASMATLPCFNSTSRRKRTRPSSASPAQKPSGSKNPRGEVMPGSDWAYSVPAASILGAVVGEAGTASGAKPMGEHVAMSESMDAVLTANARMDVSTRAVSIEGGRAGAALLHEAGAHDAGARTSNRTQAWGD